MDNPISSKHRQIKLGANHAANNTLNRLLRGGFTLPHDEACGLVVLLRGKPGTGKSTLALQVLEGLELDAPLHYCSLEQTIADLYFKRTTMLVAQAVLASWIPKYGQNQLVSMPGYFWKTLQASGGVVEDPDERLKLKIGKLLKQMTIPLYDGPSGPNVMLPEAVLALAESIVDAQKGSLRRLIAREFFRYRDEPIDNLVRRVVAKAGLKPTANDTINQQIQDVLSKVALTSCESASALSKTKELIKVTELLFDQRIIAGYYTVAFQGLEHHSVALAREGPFGVGRSRSLAALQMIETIKAGFGSPDHESVEPLGRRCRPVVVIDGLSLLSSSEREMLELQGIVDRLRQMAQIGILVYEPNAEESTSLDHHADLVMELSSRTLGNPMAYLLQELWIKKARYQETALGQHQFKIRRSGLVFFPSVHFQVQHPSYMDFELVRSTAKAYKPALTTENADQPVDHREPSSGDSRFVEGSILDLIFDPRPGESIVLLGSRGTFKTELCLDFLGQGCPAERASKLDNGLLISLINNSPNIEKGVACPWHRVRMCKDDLIPNAKCKQCTEYILRQVRPFKQPPGCISSSELLHYFIEAVSRLQDLSPKLSRLVFWDLTQLDYRFPLLKADTMLLPAMMDVFKRRNLKSLFMGAENATNTPAANAMADNVIFCWRSRHNVASDHNEASQTPEDTPEWSQSGYLMLYVDRASSMERPAKSLYKIPIMVGKYDDRRECLKAPRTKSELNGSFHRINWLDADPEDLEHIKTVRRFQGLE